MLPALHWHLTSLTTLSNKPCMLNSVVWSKSRRNTLFFPIAFAYLSTLKWRKEKEKGRDREKKHVFISFIILHSSFSWSLWLGGCEVILFYTPTASVIKARQSLASINQLPLPTQRSDNLWRCWGPFWHWLSSWKGKYSKRFVLLVISFLHSWRCDLFLHESEVILRKWSG